MSKGPLRYNKQYLLKIDESISNDIILLRSRNVKVPQLIRDRITELANDIKEKENDSNQ
jgi:hypothetical protein